jgi:hypothetical protein
VVYPAAAVTAVRATERREIFPGRSMVWAFCTVRSDGGESAGSQFDGTCPEWNTGGEVNFLTFLRKLCHALQAVLGVDFDGWC